MGPRAGLMYWREGKSAASANKQTKCGPASRLPPYLVATLWMLIIIPYVDVLGLYTIQHKTVLCYIQKLPSQVPSEYKLGICKFSDIILCYIHTM